eukprot:CAMPEP_0182418936 /NCGR_PEP_ID=MMETSP1167-20130531/3320_1 /TAXON_ID=2988 /ORGANISM="Mallomonas Sp, Strain CCMP3275" /LENGTH=452 /DNA_ID=CAMNT_0024593433 /DNA_START=333 /DNA_END=1691 /DNA_ORIENTATION=+
MLDRLCDRGELKTSDNIEDPVSITPIADVYILKLRYASHRAIFDAHFRLEGPEPFKQRDPFVLPEALLSQTMEDDVAEEDDICEGIIETGLEIVKRGEDDSSLHEAVAKEDEADNAQIFPPSQERDDSLMTRRQSNHSTDSSFSSSVERERERGTPGGVSLCQENRLIQERKLSVQGTAEDCTASQSHCPPPNTPTHDLRNPPQSSTSSPSSLQHTASSLHSTLSLSHTHPHSVSERESQTVEQCIEQCLAPPLHTHTQSQTESQIQSEAVQQSYIDWQTETVMPDEWGAYSQQYSDSVQYNDNYPSSQSCPAQEWGSNYNTTSQWNQPDYLPVYTSSTITSSTDYNHISSYQQLNPVDEREKYYEEEGAEESKLHTQYENFEDIQSYEMKEDFEPNEEEIEKEKAAEAKRQLRLYYEREKEIEKERVRKKKENKKQKFFEKEKNKKKGSWK